ncbi:hypothetical protein Tco_0565749 [Tanacetum coccineum]
MYGLCVCMRYVDYVRVGNQSIERDRLIGIGLVMDLVKFLSFTFGVKEMTFMVLAFFCVNCLRESSFQNIRPRKFLRSGSPSNVGYEKSCQSSKFGSDLGVCGSCKTSGEFHSPIFTMFSWDENDANSLIPLSRGSFDVIIGMDCLSMRKFVIVCHEKVVRIPLEDDEILRVHGERTQGVVKTLMNIKFRIDLVHGATPVAKSPYRLAPSEIEKLGSTYDTFRDMITLSETSKYEYEIRYHPGKTNVVIDALRMKERVKPRRVRAMAMTIRYRVRRMMLATQSEEFKQENGMMRTVVMDEAHASRYLVHPGADKTYYNLGDMYCLRYWSENEIESPWILSVNFPRSPVLWAEIGESSLIGPELVQETTDKVVLIKEKLKAARDRQKSYADNRRKPLEFEVGDRVMLKVSPCKGVVGFGKKGKLAPSLHVPLDEIKVDKTLRFVEELVENSGREIKRLKCSRMVVFKFLFDELRDRVVNDVVTQLKVLTSFLDDGRGLGSWMFHFVWSGYAAMRTLLWAGKVVSSMIYVKVS